jgi:acetyl-CoA carboxylase carboxyl transferase subunit alpha
MTADEQLRIRERLAKLRRMKLLGGTGLESDLERLEKQLERIQEDYTDEEIWRSVELARHAERPYTLDYVARLIEDFVELHGDRGRADDPALVTGIGRFGGRTVALIGHQKGRDLKERPFGTSAWRIPRGIARRCARWSSPTGTGSRS